MSLSGTLEIFPLEEVLRLLARSRQNGCLRVDGAGSGRIYMESGSMTYASVEPDEAIRDHLVASGVASEEGLSRLDVSGGALPEALAPSSAASALTDLIREQCVEALYRIRRPAAGEFQFLIDAHPRYPTGQAFDVETIISESDRRASEWADIETVVPDLGTPWRMVPEIDEDSVNLSDTAWRFLAAMDGACAVDELASRLGITTFQTARRMAELSRAKLVEAVTVAAPYESTFVPPEPPTDTFYQEPTREVEESPDPDRSWWLDDNVADQPEPDTEPAPEGETVLQPDSTPERDSTPEPEAVPAAEDSEGEDTFLETVFGELEKTEDPEASDDEDEGDGSFGLLRRRGLGAAFRELADS